MKQLADILALKGSADIANLTNYSNFWTPKNYIKNLGVCIEDTAVPEDWLLPNSNGIALRERVTSEKLYQTGAIMFDAKAGWWNGVTKQIEYDFTSVTSIAVAFYIEDQYSFDSCELQLSSGNAGIYNNWTKYFKINLGNTAARLHRGWNFIKVHKDNFTNIGEETWGVFKSIRFIANIPSKKTDYAYTGWTGDTVTTARFGIGGIYLNPVYDTPKLMLNFDDSSAYMFANGFPYMRKKGVPATLFVCFDHVVENGGGVSFMTEAQHDTWYLAGNDIGNHSKTHGNLYKMTESQILTEYGDTQDYLVSKGWLTGGWLSAPPNGRNNYITNKILRELGYKFVRGNKPDYIRGITSDSIMQYATQEIKNNTTVATVTGRLDTMVSKGLHLSLFTHHVVDSDPDAYSVLTADFKAIIDYAVTLRDAGQIEIVTMSEFYNGLSDKSIAQRGL